MATKNAPMEKKVKAGGVTTLVTGVVVWLLGRYVFGGVVPADVVLGVEAIVPTAAGTYAAWRADHTPRHAAPAAGRTPQSYQ